MEVLGIALRAAGCALAVVLFVVWLAAMNKWDGTDDCDTSQCGACPFPCDKRNDGRGDRPS